MPAAKKNTVKRWEVLNKCYAKGTLYREGDIVEDGDFSDNDNFKELKSVKGTDEEVKNGEDIPTVTPQGEE